MSKEYIEREETKARLRIWITDCVLDGDNEAADCFRDCIDLLDSIPAADVTPVRRGRWVSVQHKLARVCSVCNRDEPYKFADVDADVYNYCPNCGAKMDKEETDERI